MSKCEWVQWFLSTCPAFAFMIHSTPPGSGEPWASFFTQSQDVVLAHQRKHTLLGDISEGIFEDSFRDLSPMGSPQTLSGSFLFPLTDSALCNLSSGETLSFWEMPFAGSFWSLPLLDLLLFFLLHTHNFPNRVAGQNKLEPCQLMAWSLWVLSESQLHWTFVIFFFIFVSLEKWEIPN